MSCSRIEISQLRLRFPGLNAGMARGIAESALRHAASELGPVGRSVEIGDLKIRVRVPAGTPVDRLAAEIGKQIARSIREAAR
jgi:hypothetical protein